MTQLIEHSAYALTTYAREVAAHMREAGINGAMDTLAWATERNAAIGWAGYDADQRVVQVVLDTDELTLVVGLAVAIHADPDFYETLLAPED
jgi:hypothetical protein